MLVIFCVLLKRVKLVYLSAYATCLIYGAVLDLWRIIIPVFNPEITEPGSMTLPIRIIFFVLGMLLTSISIALCYRTYLYPQVYDFFVKGISENFVINRTKCKMIFDATFFVISVVLSLLLFGGFVGVYYGTIVITICNGPLIDFFGKLFDRHFRCVSTFKKLATHFEI